VAKSALDQVLVQPGFVAQATHFGASDGMRSENCNGTVQPAAWKRRDGSLWFATTRGVVRIDPSRLGQQPSSPRVLIESVRVDGRTIDRSHPGILDAATRRVDVAFTALGLHTPERAAFRYKLEGLDADWQDATGKRELEFTGLRAGKYRLVVGLAARDGEWLPAQVEYVFAVAAPFTETPRFYLLLVAGVALCGFAWHRYRLALLNARTARLQERAHIARELHDTIAQGFSGILVRLEVAARMTPEPDAATRERLAGVQAIARESMQSLRAAVAVMQPEGRIGANLDRVLREQIERQLQDTDLVWTFVCEGAPRDFGPVASHHLCRITQEAISNVLMHAAAANVDIRLSYSAEGLCLTIADDGRGLREPVARTLASGGSGIIGMRARMEEIGGLFEILDGGKGGCIVRITLAPNRGRVRAEGG
jgi:signal transduction histidine kinase